MSIDLSPTNPLIATRPRIDPQLLNRSNNNQQSGNSANTNSSDGNTANTNNANTNNANSKSVNLENNVNSIIANRDENIEKEVIRELEKRDREVRGHEQAHKAVAGRFAAGGATFKLERGPNGRFFAVAGHVNLDVSKESTPEKTIQKMRIIRKAALAPANPSSQDRAVAAQTTAKEAEAMRELAQERAENRKESNTVNGNEMSDSIKIDQNSGGVAIAGGFESAKLEGSFVDTFI